jgi:hypothetical protein
VIGAGEVSGRPVIIINSAADETKWWRDPELNCEALKFVSTGQTAPGGDLFSQQEMELDGITMGEPDRALFDTSQGVEMKPSDAYRVRLRFMGFADVEIHKLLEENKRTLDNQDARYARSRPK